MQDTSGFTLIEVVITLIILGFIILIGVQVPSIFQVKYKSMDSDADTYTDITVLKESLGKDILNSSIAIEPVNNPDDFGIKYNGKTIESITIPVNKNQPTTNQIETVPHIYLFKEDGVYRKVDKGNLVKLTHKNFILGESTKENLLVLETSLSIDTGEKNEDGSRILIDEPIQLKYYLKGSSLQKEPNMVFKP